MTPQRINSQRIKMPVDLILETVVCGTVCEQVRKGNEFRRWAIAPTTTLGLMSKDVKAKII